MQLPVPTPKRLISLLFVFAVLWFGTLDYRTLIKSDEGRYAEIAREMVASGDWVTPRYNSVKYFYKPPLQYWATASAYTVFGENEWTARLWVGLTSFLSVLMVFFAGRILFGARPALFGSIALGSMMMPVFAGHFNTLDMGVGTFMSAAMYAILLAQRDDATPSQERFWMLLCWAAMALALLSKGLMGIVLPGAVLFCYLLWTRDFSRLKRLHILKGSLVFFAICAPWFILVMRANPEFFHFFFIHEHFERFLTKVHARYGPPWYFIPFLLLGSMPWTLYLWSGLRTGLKSGQNKGSSNVGLSHLPLASKAKGLKPWRPKLLLVLWVVFIFLFFSASSSKLAGYIVPIFPALASLIGLALVQSSRSHWRLSLGFAILVSVAGFIASFWIPSMAESPIVMEDYQRYQYWVQAGLCAFGFTAVLAYLIDFRTFARQAAASAFSERPAISVSAAVVLALGAFVSTQALMLGHENLRDRGASSYSLAQAISKRQGTQAPSADYTLFLVNDFDHTLPFYLKKTALMVIDRDELDFGLKYSPDRYLPDMASFAERWKASPRAAAVMYHKTLKELEVLGLPFEVVAQDTLRVAVIKPMIKASK
jgi:4-amino-4-deoxy-L-arabinose transferase-like glycosyltransferase